MTATGAPQSPEMLAAWPLGVKAAGLSAPAREPNVAAW